MNFGGVIVCSKVNVAHHFEAHIRWTTSQLTLIPCLDDETFEYTT